MTVGEALTANEGKALEQIPGQLERIANAFETLVYHVARINNEVAIIEAHLVAIIEAHLDKG